MKSLTNVLIQEAEIVEILNFDIAIFKNVLLVPLILFICIKVPTFSFTMIDITRVCQIWMGFYEAKR